MNLNFRKTVLMMSAATALGFSYSPEVFASSPNEAAQAVQQASHKVSGTIVDSQGPVIGASILEKGTSNGTVTDLDGNYSLNVKPGATLVVTYIGYKTQEIRVGNQNDIPVTLEADNTNLDEVIVVGYGVQKKRLVTGATVEVKGDDISKLNTTQALGALQSQTPGVNIQAVSGQPGDGFKVDIRGVGSNQTTQPLYVIDGVAGGDINSLNPADIESVSVLKDAASCAIYGATGGNGVILVTTKQGKAGKVQLSYDANIGWQNVYRMPDLLTAKQYMEVQDQVRFNNNESPRDWSKYIDADLLNAYNNGTNDGTNWLDAIRNKNAITTSHSVGIAGGNDRSKFSGSVGYQYQDGIFGNMAKSDFRRLTLRFNSDHVVYRNSKGVDVIKVGENFYYGHSQKQGLQIGNQYANELSNMLRANPCIPIYDADGNYFDWQDIKASGTDGWQNYNSYSSNPIYRMMSGQSANNKNKNFNMRATAFYEIQPIKNLVYRGQFNYSQSSSTYRAYNGIFSANETNADGFNTEDKVTQQLSASWEWSTTHTINYKFNVSDHHFDALVGTEYGESKPNFGEWLQATAKHTIFNNFDQAYVGLTKTKNSDATADGYQNEDMKGLSYFGRINYDWNETYMLSLVFRADGDSRFAPGHRWGYYPSVSAGWVVSNAKFMESTKNWMDYLKIRASWGQNGNKNAASNFFWQPTFGFDAFSNYSFGNNKQSYTSGASPTRLGCMDLTWETSDQLDLGIDARFLNSRLGLTFDWYKKKTIDNLVRVPKPATTGFSEQLENAGTVENTGIEVALNWNDKIGSDFSYGVNWNMAINDNEVTALNSDRKYNEGGSDLLAQGTGYMARYEVGHPVGYFWGYKTAGVIQNAEDLQQYIKDNCDSNAANSLQGSSLKPGDLKFVDVNGDGKITPDDKTDLGNPHPDVTMGLSLNAAYKGFDFALTGYMALGQQVARSYRKFTDGEYENYTTEVYSYWHGEGTSNRYPLLAPGNAGQNWQAISDIYIEDAGYFRLQNITLGYDFKNVWKTCPFQQLRLYVAAQNLFTITNYKGMDPENGMALNSDEAWVTGVDVGNYPSPRTYMIGVNVKF